jgi:hypothetical protein
MKRIKSIIFHIFHPGVLAAVLLATFCTAALVYIFVSGMEDTVAGYFVYALTTYALAVFVIVFPEIIAGIKAAVYRNKLAGRYLTDIPFQMKVSLYMSLTLNTLYAVVKLTAGIYYASFWYGADALYYIILSAVRFLLLRHVRKGERDLKKELRQYRLCGVLLFVMNVALIGVVYQIVNKNMGYKYPGLLIYAAAIYAFYCISVSIKNVLKYRKFHNPVMSAHKAIGLAKALVAMFALQTAMFASFNDDKFLERLMNSIFGGLVCISIFGMAVLMVVQANGELAKLDLMNKENLHK